MPRLVNILRVFVASPNDVGKERERLKSIIDEVNKQIGSSSGVQLELVRYETDVAPGIGEYTQDVINKKIDDEYDIFIGIMWKKFGTTTKVAPSGTVEEFDRAYARHTMLPGTVNIMFYFKKAPVNRDEIEPEQIKLIDEFCKNLGGKGILWDKYKSMNDFEKKVRTHLHDAVKAFEKEQKTKNAVQAENHVVETKKNIREISGSLPSWGLLFEHDENGNRIEGNIEHLIEAVVKGYPIRLRIHHSENNIQVMDAPLLSIENGIVHASDINQISKTKDKSGNYVYQDKSYHYYVIANSKGHFHKRIYLDGIERNTTNSKRHMAWFGLGPPRL
jgi:hypothetical protein